METAAAQIAQQNQVIINMSQKWHKAIRPAQPRPAESSRLAVESVAAVFR